MDAAHEGIAGEQLVRCERLGEMRTVEEHRCCPYCYGTDRAVATGDRGRFCDFEPGEDPIHFGFPEGTSRRLC